MKRILVFVLALIVALMSFAMAEEAAEPITLAEWNGSWNNALLYLDHEQVQKAVM